MPANYAFLVSDLTIDDKVNKTPYVSPLLSVCGNGTHGVQAYFQKTTAKTKVEELEIELLGSVSDDFYSVIGKKVFSPEEIDEKVAYFVAKDSPINYIKIRVPKMVSNGSIVLNVAYVVEKR